MAAFKMGPRQTVMNKVTTVEPQQNKPHAYLVDDAAVSVVSTSLATWDTYGLSCRQKAYQ